MRTDLEAIAREARGFMPHNEGMGLYETALRMTSADTIVEICLLYTSPSPRDLSTSRMPSSA